MNNNELIFSFIVGVASGIVSSVLVTAFYRKKDGEKDRQSFFMSFRKYVSQLIAIELSDIDGMSDYFSANELPKVFKWIHLNKDELKIVLGIIEKISELQDLILAYEEEKLKLLDSTTKQEAKDILIPKYLSAIVLARTEIICANLELTSLGNKTLTKYIKKNKKFDG